jgi:hypothetical protein
MEGFVIKFLTALYPIWIHGYAPNPISTYYALTEVRSWMTRDKDTTGFHIPLTALTSLGLGPLNISCFSELFNMSYRVFWYLFLFFSFELQPTKTWTNLH